MINFKLQASGIPESIEQYQLALDAAFNAGKAIAAAGAAPVPEGWQPIATAPKDGSEIIVMYMHIDTQIVHNAFWLVGDDDDSDPSGWWSYDHSEVSRIKLDDWMAPTHWTELPEAPKEPS